MYVVAKVGDMSISVSEDNTVTVSEEGLGTRSIVAKSETEAGQIVGDFLANGEEPDYNGKFAEFFREFLP